jgi:hypothetical protein
MPKTKQRRFAAKKPPKKRQRVGYSTVARTRGPLATGEMKYFDCARTSSAINGGNTWAGTEIDPTLIPVAGLDTLFAPTVGAGINQRIGKSANVHKIKIRGHCFSTPEVNQDVGSQPAYIRIILYQDLQTNGTQAGGEDVMQTVAANALANTEAFQNIDNFGRFRVLKDKSIVLQDPNMNSTSATEHLNNGLIRMFKFNINFKRPVKVRFNATNGGTIADIVDNSWHMLAITSSASGLVPGVSYNCRVCFKE